MNDRKARLDDVRCVAEERMDTLWAPIYDENWGATLSATHARYLARFLSLVPPHAAILDAACGTGKVWPMILAAGHSLAGIDQSQGMLARARLSSPACPRRSAPVQIPVPPTAAV